MAGVDHHVRASVHRQDNLGSRRKANYPIFRRGSSARPLFSWADHPGLITDAVENGWSRFGFTNYISFPSTKSSLLGLCAVGDQARESEVEIGWEVGQGSVDFMQKVRLNRKMLGGGGGSGNSSSALSVIRTALPLPGPGLGNCSGFPQEAYFEIAVLSLSEEVKKVKAEGERTKLIDESGNLDSLLQAGCHGSGSWSRQGAEDGGGRGAAAVIRMSVGLTTGGVLPFRNPGSYPGSIGFGSDGSLFLDGMKLVSGSEKQDWAQAEKVIGCGFDPRQKKVFFTVGSQLVHEIHCKAEEFGTPLYPVLAANIDITVVVNFGQSSFSYAPANAHRTPNPCFVGPAANPAAATIGDEDSRELFSMRRIDSGWLSHCGTKSSTASIGIIGGKAVGDLYEEESEGELFEIVLDACASRHSVKSNV